MTSEADTRFYPRVFALVAAALLTLAVLRMLQPFIGAIMWSVLLAFLFHRANARLCLILGGRRGPAAALSTAGGTMLILVPAVFLAAASTTQAAELFRKLQATAGEYQIARPSDLLRLPVVHQFLQWLESVTPVGAAQVQQGLVASATRALEIAVASGGALVGATLGTLVSLCVTLFLLFFFLRGGADMVDKALLLIPLEPERQGRLLEHLSAVTSAVVFGSLITAIVQGFLVGIAFALTGLPSPVVFGVVAGVAAVVPL